MIFLYFNERKCNDFSNRHIIRKDYKKGFSRQDIINLLRLMDWIMDTPKDLEQFFVTQKTIKLFTFMALF